MTNISALTMVSVLCAAANVGHAQDASHPSIKMKCFNPNLNVSFTSVQRSQASTEPVQFNVNIPAGKGTIFVNEHNHGVCNATISDGFSSLADQGKWIPRRFLFLHPTLPKI